MGVLDTLNNATAGRRTVEIILDEALEAEWLAAQSKLAKAADSDVETGSLAMPATTALVNEMEKLREQVAASQVTFVFERLDWRARVALQAEHPPRDGNRVDSLRGYNLDTYVPAMIRATCVSVTDADGDTATEIPEATWVRLLGNADTKPLLGFGQVERLFGAATTVNDGTAKVPTSARFLQGMQDSGASLAQPGPGTSALSASKAGSRRGARKSTATKKAASPA